MKKPPSAPSKPPTRLRKAARQVAAVASAVAEEGRGVLEAVRAVLTDSIDPRIRKMGREASDEDLARFVLLSEPAAMAQRLSKGSWVPAKHLLYLSKAIHDAVDTRGGGRLIVSMPRRHGKSELCSHWTPLWFLARYPTHRVILTSYETGYAEEWGGKVRDTMMQWAPLLGLQTRGDSTARGRWDLVGGGGMFSVGAGGALMGRGGHLVIVDDPFKSWEEAQSETERKKVWDWFQATILLGLEPRATVIVVMTRWHSEDLVGKILDSPDAGEWTYIKLPRFAGVGDPLGRAVGETLWPERHTQEDGERQQRLLDPRVFAALSQQEPSLIEGDLLKRHWWRYYNPKALPPLIPGSGEKWERLLQSWDTTFKKSATSDFVAGQVWGLWRGNLYLVAQEHARMGFTDTCDAIKAMSIRFPEAKTKLIEESANGYAIIETLQHEVHGILPVATRGQSKRTRLIGQPEERAHAVSMLIKSGLVWLPEPHADDPIPPSEPSLPWVKGFVDECAAFTGVGDQQDDQVDAMTQALRIMQPSAWVGAKREPQPTTIAEMRAREHEAYLKKLMRPKEEEGRRERYEYLNLNR